MKAEYNRIIDSIKFVLEFREKHPITQTISSSYIINNKRVEATKYVEMLEKERVKNIGVINYLLGHTNLASSEIDSLLKANDLK